MITLLMTACAQGLFPEDSQPMASVSPGVNLIAFVGRRIEARRVEPRRGEIPFDTEYVARFEVLEVVFGSYSQKEMTLSSYVHMGEPKFLQHEVGLVYVSRYDDRFIQQKYLYQALYPTNDGRWASCGDPYQNMPDVHRHGLKPEPITFRPPVRCVMGNYPRELFRVMAEGVLKARGVFDPAATELFEAR